MHNTLFMLFNLQLLLLAPLELGSPVLFRFVIISNSSKSDMGDVIAPTGEGLDYMRHEIIC